MIVSISNPVQDILDGVGAVKQGHFVLNAQGHSEYYVNNGEVSPDSEALLEICRLMAPHFVAIQPEFFACPAEAAIGFTQLMALAYNECRAEGAPKAYAVYAGKDGDGFVFRRGQANKVAGKHGVVLDDVGTTGGSVKKVVDLVRESGGEVDCVAYICIRGEEVTPGSVGGVKEVWAPLWLSMSPYSAEDCPLCKSGTPIDTVLGHGKAFVAEHGQPVAH